ncbi:hypothetical protein FQN55_009270 [Onygenales sp. PD_40]|nr:hypothetical protein FQN55_009270 [Onygenales sp. PD_40]KAK2777580.1 hypothetical protein FQN53_002198 [Emmonsiellopsis sp. PD_33]KAK2782077.1 hypothetical protein FQN52_001190 [Onygenales sp. PD_12]KAK2798695.1 hypothetical protein FQN51_007557 [Onygenales sp. PD_10]
MSDSTQTTEAIDLGNRPRLAAQFGFKISENLLENGVCLSCADLPVKARMCQPCRPDQTPVPCPNCTHFYPTLFEADMHLTSHPVQSRKCLSREDAKFIRNLVLPWCGMHGYTTGEQFKGPYCEKISQTPQGLISHSETHPNEDSKCGLKRLELYLREKLFQGRLDKLSAASGNQFTSENPESSRKRKGSDSDMRDPKKRAADDGDEMDID